MIAKLLCLALLILFGAPVPDGRAAVEDDGAPRPRLAGMLAAVPDLWSDWASRHLEPGGRVVDDGNGGISHSEGQGYGLVLALAAEDRAAFGRIWTWTRQNLLVRPDGLPAWRWDPAARPRVADPNDATDGTILIAWALAEAGEAWDEPAYRSAARRLVRSLAAGLAEGPGGVPLILPATKGFGAGERRDGPVVNPSYWVFPAFRALAEAAPEWPAADLGTSGLALLQAARFGPAGLPADWVAWRDAAQPAAGFPAQHGYNALRVPLYLAWARAGLPGSLSAYRNLAAEEPAIRDLATGQIAERLPEPGYAAIGALVACALDGTRLPDRFRHPSPQHYYPATLGLLAVIAVRQEYPQCW